MLPVTVSKPAASAQAFPVDYSQALEILALDESLTGTPTISMSAPGDGQCTVAYRETEGPIVWVTATGGTAGDTYTATVTAATSGGSRLPQNLDIEVSD